MTSLLRRPGNFARYSRRASELLTISPSRTLYLNNRPCRYRLGASRSRNYGLQCIFVRSYATNSSDDPKSPRNNISKRGDRELRNIDGDKRIDPVESKLTEDEEKLLEKFKPYYEQLTTGPFGPTGPPFEEFRTIVQSEGIPPEVKSFIESLGDSNRGMISLADFKHAAGFSKYLAGIQTRKSERIFGEHTPQAKAQNKQSQKSEKENIKGESEQKAGDQKQKQKQQQRKDSGQKPKGIEIKLDAGNILVTSILAYYIYHTFFPGESTREITWQEFRNNFFDKGLVEKLTVINRNRVRVELNREAAGSVYPDSPAIQSNFHYIFTIGSVDAFERKLEEAHRELGIPPSQWIPVAYVDEVSWLHTLASLGPTVILLGSFLWLSRRAGGAGAGQSGIFGIGKSRAKRFNHETDIKIRFSDVAGMDEAKLEIMEFVSFLKEPEKFQKLGAKIPRGAILSGPPGTGKTLLAKATAGESAVPFFSVSGSEFVEMFVGVGPSRVRDLFANARKNTPCIIFIDEIDAIGKSRAKQSFGGGNDERESTLNQILTEMDGFNTSEQVVVLAGTNRPDVLDKALMRPGRFDRHIAIDRPTMEGRKQIFRVHLKKIVTKDDFDYLCGRLAALTPGFSGADIANCVNEAALVAAREHADCVVMKHFEQAIERVVGGLEKKSLVLSPEEKRTVAYHEAGHAICGWYFKWADPLLKVSIIPRGQGALGYAQYLPAGGDTYLMNVNQLMDRMAMTLGGRVSEELHFDTVTSGASDDFNKVTRMATAMVTKFGMSPKIGYIYFEEDQQQLHKPFSEETSRNIDLEVKRIVDEAYKKSRDLLTEKKEQVGLVAEELLSKEVLSRDDLVRILGPRPFPDPGEFTKYFGAGPSQTGSTISPPEPPSMNDDIGGKDGRDQGPVST